MKYLFIFSLLFLFSCESTPEAVEEKDAFTTSDTSDITCPHCGYTETETLPTDQCLLVYNCKQCSQKLTPQGDDCCVFCSYGTHECPSIQEDNVE